MSSSFSILQDSMATTYEDEGPIPWFRTEQCIFYIVFFVVFPFFFVNIFVALIIVTFNELGEAELEDDMDKNQKSCIDFAIRARLSSWQKRKFLTKEDNLGSIQITAVIDAHTTKIMLIFLSAGRLNSMCLMRLQGQGWNDCDFKMIGRWDYLFSFRIYKQTLII